MLTTGRVSTAGREEIVAKRMALEREAIPSAGFGYRLTMRAPSSDSRTGLYL